MKTIFGREPATAFALLATLINALLLLLFDWPDEVHGAVNAAVLAAAGLATAFFVSVDAVLPRIAGFIQAVFGVLLAFGLDVPAATQTSILAVVAAVVSFWVRTQVEAIVPARDGAVR